MKKQFTQTKGYAIPLNRADVDTGQIIPAKHLKRIERKGFGQYAFERWRDDPNFVLNHELYKGAPIMICGPNFGCGSSREHAPWALQDIGLKVLISSSFADIFRNNCANCGLLTIQLPQVQWDFLLKIVLGDPIPELTVDLQQQTISGTEPIFDISFQVDSFLKYRLLNGLDMIASTLEHEGKIKEFESLRPTYFPQVGV